MNLIVLRCWQNFAIAFVVLLLNTMMARYLGFVHNTYSLFFFKMKRSPSKTLASPLNGDLPISQVKIAIRNIRPLSLFISKNILWRQFFKLSKDVKKRWHLVKSLQFSQVHHRPKFRSMGFNRPFFIHWLDFFFFYENWPQSHCNRILYPHAWPIHSEVLWGEENNVSFLAWWTLTFFLQLFFLFLLQLLLSLFLLLGLLVLPHRRLQVAPLPFLLFLFLWSGLARFCHFNLRNTAWGEDAVSMCHAAGNETPHTTWHALPALWLLAAGGQRHRGGWHSGWRSWNDRAFTVGYCALFQLLAVMLFKQFRDGKPSLTHLWWAVGTEWTATGGY